LRENARAPVAELARRLEISRTTVQSRLERLERRGIVAGYTLKPSQADLGLIRCHVMIAAHPRAAGAVEAALRRMEAARTVYSVAGPFDLIALLATPTVGDMDAALDAIGALEGVERTTSAIILSTKISRE
jgi:DNA-binding Lrp family transcriptional regulator